MSRWKIYSKDGSVLHESIEKYDGKGRVVEQDTLEYSGKWMGDCFITVSFKSAYPIDFQIGDYIIYRGEKFTINYDPAVVKKSSRGAYGEGFVYDSVKFNALSNELTDVKFHDWVLSDNKIHYTSLPNFSFYAKDMNDLADRLQACMDRWCKDNGFAKEDYWIFYTPGSAGDTNPYDRTITRAKDISTDETFLANVLTRWKSIYGDGGTLVERADELFDKNVQISNQTVWQGMALFKSDFGLNFIIRGREVIVGAAGVVASHIFKYGKGNGLYEVEKQADTDQKVVTRLHAYGSSDNLPTRYYAELGMSVTGHVEDVYWQANHDLTATTGKGYGWKTDYLTEFSLDIPFKPAMFTKPTYSDGVNESEYNDPWGYFVRIAVEGGPTVNACVHVNSYGSDATSQGRACVEVRYNAGGTAVKAFEWQNTDPTSFKQFSDLVTKGKKMTFVSGVDKDKAPAEAMDYTGDMLPDNMAIMNLMLPGFPKYALADLCKADYEESSDTTHYYIRKDKDSSDWVEFHSEAGSHVIRFSKDRHDPYIVSPNADAIGYKDEDIYCTEEKDDNGLKKVYPSVEEITEAEAGVSSDDKTYINTIVSADIIKDNGVYPKKTGTSVPGFQVVIKNLGFDLHDAIAAAGGESCKLSMKDGHCGGHDFDVPSVSKNSDGTWTLNCKRSQDSGLDIYYPYSYNMSIGGEPNATEPYQICKGDHYVLLGISLEETNYVWAASVKLLRKAIHWLCKNDYSRYTYSPKIDEIYMARQDQEAQKSEGKVKSLHDTLKEGDLLWFQDDDLLLDGKVYIDQLVIKENGNNGIPTYDVTLRNEVNVGTIQRIQNKVDSIANDVKSGNVGGTVSPANVENITKAVGDTRYLRKDQDDTTEHKLTMGEAEVTGNATLKGGISIGTDGSYTITPDGIATLAGLVAGYLQSKDFSAGTGRGFDGTGYGITKNPATGKYTLEVDNLIARMKMVVAQLEVHEMSFIGGTVVMSACGNRMLFVEPLDAEGDIITDTTTPDRYRCYFLATDGEQSVSNKWTVGQLARCQTNNITAAGKYTDYENRDYWRLVVGVSSAPVEKDGKTCHWIDLSNSTSGSISLTDASGTVHVVTIGGVSATMNSAPRENDCVVGMGHQWDTDRQDVAIISASGWVLYKGIDHYDLPKANIINKFGIDEVIITSDHYSLRPYAQPDDVQTALCYRGAYADGNWYGRGDLVSHIRRMWLCVVKLGDKITGQAPSDGSPYWVAYSDKAADVLSVTRSGNGLVRIDAPDVITLAIRDMYGNDVTADYAITVSRDSGNATADSQWRRTVGTLTKPWKLTIRPADLTEAALSGSIPFTIKCRHITDPYNNPDITRTISETLDSTRQLRIAFQSDKGSFVLASAVNVKLTGRILYGDDDYTARFLADPRTEWTWSRDSGNAEADKGWKPKTGDTPNILSIEHHYKDPYTRADCGPEWRERLQVSYTLTAKVYIDVTDAASATTITATVKIGS